MLPTEYHEEICKLLCTWLRRLEERDRKDAKSYKTTNKRESEGTRTILEDRITNKQPMSDLSTSEHSRAAEKCLSRDATR